MSLKIHLIIVSLIVIVLTLGWQAASYWGNKNTPHQSPRGVIQVVRATLGLNCDPSTLTADITVAHPAGDFNDNSQKIKEDNVHQQISQLCNGKTTCSILNNTDALGFDPAPNCFDKQILVEYRCYAFDRLWQVIIPPHESGSVDCTNVVPPT